MKRVGCGKRPARFALVLAGCLLAVPAQSVEAMQVAPAASEFAKFYAARSERPIWFGANGRSRVESAILIDMLEQSAADGLDPKNYDIAALKRAVAMARGGNPRLVAQADRALSRAFVKFVRDLRYTPRLPIYWVDEELKPTPPTATAILSAAASAPSLRDYLSGMHFMNPIYVGLRNAIIRKVATDTTRQQLLHLNLERARMLPPAQGKYVVVNATGARLTMFEGPRIVDSMRVVVGQPKYPTPMMAAYIRYASLNPFWNVPPDLAAERIAPNVVTGGTAYLRSRGYQVMSSWTDNARPINPRSIDWKAVADGRTEVRLRQLPGPANSMGAMKFMFPNALGIYLHDTPQKELLSEAARMFSGGCVRLEDASRLARWMFGYVPRPKGARAEQRVDLPKPIPVYITYLTAMPAGGGVAYFPDVYGRDNQYFLRRQAAQSN